MFCGIFFAFLKFELNFQYFEKNGPRRSSFSEVIDSERCARLNA